MLEHSVRPTHAVPAGGEPFVFLCHATEDNGFVRPLREELDVLGVRTWLAESDVGMGEPLPQCISEALVHCTAAAVILTTAFFMRPYPMRELLALLHVELVTGRRRVLPLRVGISAADVLGKEPLVGTLKSTLVKTPAVGARVIAEALKEFAPPDMNDALFERLKQEISDEAPTEVSVTALIHSERQRARRDWRDRPRCPKCGEALVDAGPYAICESCARVSAI